MWKGLYFAALAALTAILQISFFSQVSFPLSALSFPIVAIVYGVVRDRPLLAVGWALIGGFFLDLHGLLGFGSEIASLFATFFVARYLFQRVMTNTNALALFLLGAVAAVTHWFALAAIDGMNVLFGGVPVLVDLSSAALFAPVRQGLVDGAALLLLIGLENLIQRRFRKTFLSHAPHAFS